MSLRSKTSLPYGGILQQKFRFVNTLHKKSFLPLDRLTKVITWNIMPSIVKEGQEIRYLSLFPAFFAVYINIIYFLRIFCKICGNSILGLL